MDAAWAAIGEGIDLTSPMGRLLDTVRNEFHQWSTGLVDNISKMIQFGTAPVEQDLEVAHRAEECAPQHFRSAC